MSDRTEAPQLPVTVGQIRGSADLRDLLNLVMGAVEMQERANRVGEQICKMLQPLY